MASRFVEADNDLIEDWFNLIKFVVMKTVSELFFTLGFDWHLSGFLMLFTSLANLFMNKFWPEHLF